MPSARDVISRYDLFVSYARADNQAGRITEFIDQVVADYAHFTGRRLRYFFDKQEIRGMDDWRHRICGALRESRLLIAFLSPSFVTSGNCRWEVNEYRKRQVELALLGEGIAPIYFVPIPGWQELSENESWLSIFNTTDRFNDAFLPWHEHGVSALREQAVRTEFQRLNTQLRDRLKRIERTLDAPGNVNRHNERFVGRESALRTLHGHVGLGKAGSITILHGLGGIGKTALATEYAHVYAHMYPGGRWQVGCAGHTRLTEAVSMLAVDLGLEQAADPEVGFRRVIQELKRRAKEGAIRWQQTWHDDEGADTPAARPATLLLLDNVDSPAILAPDQAGRLPSADYLHVLVTTRLGERELDPTQPDRVFLAVDELEESEALDLIRGYLPQVEFAGEAEETAAREIVSMLGRYPLAVESMAVYLGYFAGSVTCSGVLQKLCTGGLEWLDQAAAKTATHAAVRHGEQRLAATLLPTWELLDPEARRVLALASLLPADRVVLAWVRAEAGNDWPALGRDAEPGEPDEWFELVRRLRSLRLFQPTGDAGVERIHQLVRAFLRSRMSPDEIAMSRADLVRHVEDRGRDILQSWAGDVHRDEIAAIHAFVRELAKEGEDHWDELVRCARVYCTLATRVRGAVDLLERWAAEGQIDRLRETLDEDPDEFRRGLYALAIATLLARHEQVEQALEFWNAGRPSVRGPLLYGDGDASFASSPTIQLARALERKGGPIAPAVPVPHRVISASSTSVPVETRIPWPYRALATADGSVGWLLRVAFVCLMLVGAPIAAATLVLDPWTHGAMSIVYDRWVVWIIGTPFLLAMTGIIVVYPFTSFALKRLAGRIGGLFAGLAQALKRDPSAVDDSVLWQAFEICRAFRAGDDERKDLSRSWTDDLEVLILRGFPRIAKDPAGIGRVARLVERMSIMDAALVEALVASFEEIDPSQLQAIVQKLVRSPNLREPALELALRAGERLPDAGVLVDLLHAGESDPESFTSTVSSRQDCLGRLSSACLGKALLVSLAAEKGGRPTAAAAAWRTAARRILIAELAKLGATEIAGDAVDQTWRGRLALLPVWPGVLMFRLMSNLFEMVARTAGQLVLAAGRLHDPYALARVLAADEPKRWREGLEAALTRVDSSSVGGRVTVPVELRRLKEALLAQHLLRAERLPSHFVPTRTMFKHVLARLVRPGLLASRPQLLLTYAGDREWLEVVARSKPSTSARASRPGAIGEAGAAAAADCLQLRRVVPLPAVTSWALSTVLAALLVSCWLVGTAGLLPRDARGWLFPYVGPVTLGCAVSLVAISHVPSLLRAAGLRQDWVLKRLLLSRVLIGLAFLSATGWAYGREIARANRDGVGVPGLDYGWSGLTYVLPFVPVVLAAVVAPELIARWRGGTVLYPTAGRLWRERFLVIFGGAAVCMALAGACAVLARGSSMTPEPPAWPDDGDRGADLIAEAMVEEVRTKDEVVGSVTGGHRGLAWGVHLVLSHVRLDRSIADVAPVHVHTRRIVAGPRAADGRVVTGALGQWFIPRSGERVRLYLKHRPKGPFNVVLPNGIDRLTDEGVTHFHAPEPVPGPSEVIREDPLPFGQELGAAVLGALLGAGLLAVVLTPLWLLGRSYRQVRARWSQRGQD